MHTVLDFVLWTKTLKNKTTLLNKNIIIGETDKKQTMNDINDVLKILEICLPFKPNSGALQALPKTTENSCKRGCQKSSNTNS